MDFGEAKTDFTFEVSLNNKKHCVNVRQRPHMSHFLQRCAELFELVIFTASQKLYAEQLLNIIDPGRLGRIAWRCNGWPRRNALYRTFDRERERNSFQDT